MKFEHQISEITHNAIVPSTEELYCLNSDQKLISPHNIIADQTYRS